MHTISCLIFFSFQELKDVLHTVPESVEMIGTAATNRLLLLDEEDEEEDLKSALRLAFTRLMSAPTLLISKVISELTRRLHSESEVTMQCFTWFLYGNFLLQVIYPFFLENVGSKLYLKPTLFIVFVIGSIHQ